jgi:hypothetical protein
MKTHKHTWLVKASWRATALKFIVEAGNAKQALMKAEGRVFRMEGGVFCHEVKLVKQLT